jgi:hypothetical protein
MKMNIDDLTLGQIKQLQAMIGNNSPLAQESCCNDKYVIVRSVAAGVFFGKIKSRDGNNVIMDSARRLWYWKGAASLSQLATEGPKNPGECKFSVVTNGHEVLNICEIIPVTEAAEKEIKVVNVWKM